VWIARRVLSVVSSHKRTREDVIDTFVQSLAKRTEARAHPSQP
jgi:hypothetical protein